MTLKISRSKFAAAVVVVGLGAVAGAAAAAPSFQASGGRHRIARVQKGKTAESLHVYWASPLSDKEVLVTPYLEHTEMDSQFEIID